MPQVKVELTFDNMEQARSFFYVQSSSGGAVSATPPPLASAAPTAAVIPTIPSAEALAPAQAVKSPADQVSEAMNAMIARMPSGVGAGKGRELLNKYGKTRIRDISEQNIATALIADCAAA